MHRILQRRRMRKLRVVWVSLALMALSLAACSALFTAWTWRQTRDLSQSFKILQDRLEQVNTQRKAIVQLILEKRELLVGHRVKRDGTGSMFSWRGCARVSERCPRAPTKANFITDHKLHALARASRVNVRNGTYSHMHARFTGDTQRGEEWKRKKMGEGGVIRGWEEETLNMSKAVRYNKEQGTFIVERAGVYFLYCQVLFNEQESHYVKLDLVARGLKIQRLQCMEGYGTTPAAGPQLFHFLKPCQVSGLLRLDKGAELQAITGPSFKLHAFGKTSSSPHVFSIFKVN
ncbi:Tumor necrosis factor ligand superfamily member 12 [Merluccius polli]|uniref:Tumor necrosis factor ligand superfamily member 12 n=1 Tax=Merluccius polli TaxID=89951 RepID=A0AA47MQM1_MERPO|nr:Tumor necrosis factor ligand superfamily member 12 [Merluccius polli]